MMHSYSSTTTLNKIKGWDYVSETLTLYKYKEKYKGKYKEKLPMPEFKI